MTDDTRLPERVRRRVTEVFRVVSAVFNPLVVPVAGIVLLLFGDTVLRPLPMAAKWYFIGVGTLGMAVIPGLSMLLMRNMRVVSDLAISNRRERFLPMAVLLVCYAAFFLMIRHVAVAILIKKYVLAAIGCMVLALGVTAFRKISAHMIAAGGFTAMLAMLTVSGLGNMLVPLVVAILVSGVLGSARLWLGHHTPAQVAAGYFGGFAVAAAVVLLF